MVYTAGTELGADSVGCRETEVRNRQTKPPVEAEDVLWLEVAMINMQRVAVLDCVKQLQKYFLNKFVIAQITAMVEDLREQVAVRAVIHHDEREAVFLDDSVEGNDMRVRGDELMQRDLLKMQAPLP